MGESKIVQPVRYFLSLAFLGGGGGLLLYFFFSGAEEPQLLVIEPNQYVHEVPVLEGKSVTIPLHIVSKTSNTVRIQKVSASCGCAGLFADDDRPIAPSFDIHGKESIPMKAIIDSDGIAGDRFVRVAAQYVFGDNKKVAVCDLKIHVYPALRCLNMPELILDEGDSDRINQTIFVGDAFPDSGILVDSVSSNLPDVVSCHLRKIESDAVSADVDHSTSLNWHKNFRQRYAIDFSFSRDVRRFESHTTVSPSVESYKPLVIPICYEGSRKKPTFFPSQILISPGSQQSNNRIEIHVVEGKYYPIEKLSVESLPDWLQIQSITKTDGHWILTFNMIQPPREALETSVAVCDGTGYRLAEIPIRVLGNVDNYSN